MGRSIKLGKENQIMNTPLNYIGINKLSGELNIEYTRLLRICRHLNIQVTKQKVERPHRYGGIQLVKMKLITRDDADKIRAWRREETNHRIQRGYKRIKHIQFEIKPPHELIDRAKRECMFFSDIEIKIKLQCTAPMARAIAKEIQSEGI